MELISPLLVEYCLVILFLNVLASQLGLPLPLVPLLVVMSASSVAGDVALGPLFGVAFSACLMADLVWYTAGRRYGSRVLKTVCRLSLSPDSCVSQTQSLFARWGVWTLVVAKFIPGLGPIATALSGHSRVPLWVFVLLDALGIALFIGSFIWLGRAFHLTVDAVLNALASYGRVGLASVFVALLLFLALRLAQRHLLIRALRMTRISVAELKRLLDSGTPYAIYDVRAAASRERDGTIPGALPWSLEEDELPEAASSPDTQVIVYCDCPNEYSAAKVARRLQRAGFTRVRPLHGGIQAWIEAGHEIVRPTCPL